MKLLWVIIWLNYKAAQWGNEQRSDSHLPAGRGAQKLLNIQPSKLTYFYFSISISSSTAPHDEEWPATAKWKYVRCSNTHGQCTVLAKHNILFGGTKLKVNTVFHIDCLRLLSLICTMLSSLALFVYEALVLSVWRWWTVQITLFFKYMTAM